MSGWLVVAGLLGIGVMLWLNARPSSWWYPREAFEERPPELRRDRPVRGVLVRRPLGELEERRGRG